ncbi:MAG UNVERIFIED_CONTAM: hypothetical protein LVR18_42445 [Planctomycetaceae bacterium]|jgi:hypothetical protein
MVVVRTLLMVVVMVMGLLSVFQRDVAVYPAAQAQRLPVAAFPETARQLQLHRTCGCGLLMVTSWPGGICDSPAKQSADAVVSWRSGHRAGRTGWYRLAAALKCDVLAIDYHGYGDSEGSPTDMINDAQAGWRHATGPLVPS